MPHKDPIAAAAYKRAYYSTHKEQWVVGSRHRREKQREEKALQKLAAVLLRKTAVKKCEGCSADITSAYIPKHGMKCVKCRAAYHRNYRAVHAARVAEQKRAWKAANKDRVEQKDRLYAAAHPDRRDQARKKWSAANPGKDNASKALNVQSRKRRVPTWLSEDDKWMIAQAYELAALRTKMFGFAWHVDHVIPLQGKRVSGLHVPTNLQVIPGVENVRKGSTYHG